ncbi:MAG TPA: TerB family tellurite resistance protein [Gammaproteobacteria bacterium]
MLERLRQLLERHLAPSPGAAGHPREHALQLVTAALLLETARADFAADADELVLVEQLVAERFDLAAEECALLLASAGERVDEAVSLFEFTHLLNREMDEADKLGVLEMMWRVAHADGRIDKHEVHLLRRVADLLHLRHQDFVRLRLEVAGGD